MMESMRTSSDNWRRVQANLLSSLQRRMTPVSIVDGSPQKRDFHSSSKRDGMWHLVIHTAAYLKSSGALTAVQTVGRIALTLLPMAVIKRSLFRKLIKVLPLSEHPTLASLHKHMQSSISAINVALWGLLIVPAGFFVATILASMERTPITGRWRLILLSPEEERSVAADLAGDGWKEAVVNILTEGKTVPLPRVIPRSDWRSEWVLQTWRHLEAVVPLMQADDAEIKKAFERFAKQEREGQDVIPFPPPSEYALMPRPRATTLLHSISPCMSDVMEEAALATLSSEDDPIEADKRLTSQDPPPHTLLGPPYSVLLVDKPQSANAFSYGFGPNGAGGVVVYSGFIDEILRKTDPAAIGEGSPSSTNSGSRSFLSLFTGSSTSQQPSIQAANTIPTQYTPTQEQTTLLAILLAHEMAHLVLSHHLETLSSNSILIPTVVGMFSDLARTLVFPFTMVFGPFVNDALWEVSKLGTGEVVKNTEACTVRALEVEADVVGARLLAYAGFDARAAVKFWEEREAADTCAEAQCKSKPAVDADSPSILSRIRQLVPIAGPSLEGAWFTKTGSDHAGPHPISAERLNRLRAELQRWEHERTKFQKTLSDDVSSPVATA